MKITELFYRAVNLDEHPELGPTLLAFAKGEIARFASKAGQPQDPSPARAAAHPALPLARCRELISAYAPIGLHAEAHLRGVSIAATHHTDLGARLLRVYRGVRDHAALFRALVTSAGLALPEPTEARFTELPIPEVALRRALVSIAMARFARPLLPELVGFALHNATRGLPPRFASATETLAKSGADTRFMSVRGDADAIRGIAAELDGSRVQIGLAAALGLDEEWASAVERKASLHERMIALVCALAPLGHGYHKARALGDASLDECLDPKTLDPERVLRELSRSSYVDPLDPPNSRIVIQSTRGMMRGVFTSEQIATLTEWIASLGPRDTAVAPSAPIVRTAESAAQKAEDTARMDVPVVPAPARSRLRTRELYHLLVNADLHPDVGAAARDYVDRALARVRISALFTKYQRYFSYTPAAFNAFCNDRHKSQVAEYKPFDGRPILNRKQALWVLHQISPMTLVDGCWLQDAPASPVGDMLFGIYYDEVGEGNPAENHANIHRALLARAGIEMPAVDAPALADSPDFVDAAFELPTLWLGVAHASRRYLPELLGLNFAMELAGIGGPYMQFADLLRHHGIEPTIVELHNSVDNLANGHSAWARDAIHAHLDDARASGGEVLVQAVWRRIWLGYRAHNVYFDRFSRACALRLLPGVIADRLRA